jgi:hypothetical protein
MRLAVSPLQTVILRLFMQILAECTKYYPHIRTNRPVANWYNRKEPHSEQFEFCLGLLFLSALNLILS